MNLNLRRQIVIYDFETNGLYDKGNHPIEAYMTIVSPNGGISNYNSYIKSNKKLSEKITKLTGITDEILKEKGRDITDVSKEMGRLIIGQGDLNTLLVGHNSILFDNLFLRDMLTKVGYPMVMNSDCFDTAGHFKAELMGWEKWDNLTYAEYHRRALETRRRGVYFNLGEACKYYSVARTAEFHRADADVYYTMQVFLKQLSREGLLNKTLKQHIK